LSITVNVVLDNGTCLYHQVYGSSIIRQRKYIVVKAVLVPASLLW